MKFKRQPKEYGGWTIDVELLSSVSNGLHEDTTLHLEEIEEVLLALELVDMTISLRTPK